jgi:hypothetical protein
MTNNFVVKDDDIDISCMRSVLVDIESLIHRSFPTDLCIYRDTGNWNGRIFSNLTFFENTPSCVVIDVWPIDEVAPLATFDCCERFEEVFPLKRVSFAGMQLPAPQLAHQYLSRVYPTYRTECVVWAHHDNFRFVAIYTGGDLHCKSNVGFCSLRNVWRVSLEEYLMAVERAAYARPILPIRNVQVDELQLAIANTK